MGAVSICKNTSILALEPKFKRTLVIGDIHGACLALDQVLERSNFDPSQDRLISLGDLVDYNPENTRTIDTLMQIPNLIAVRGNHDTFAQYYLETAIVDPIWRSNGGIPTIAEFDQFDDRKRNKFMRFFQNQVPYFVDESNRLFIHAGFQPDLPLKGQSENYYYWDRSLWEDAREAIESGRQIPQNDFNEVFIGHTPTIKNWPDALPKNFGNIWNLDQGVKNLGKLTIMDVETKEFWQSDPNPELYT